MANILVAWEFGGGLGHLSHLAPFINSLISLGHRVVLATREATHLDLFNFPDSLIILPTPQVNLRTQQKHVNANITSILMPLGYGDPAALKGMVKGWQGIIELANPDLIIFDYAPTALLAAKETNCKKVVIGSGFAELLPNSNTNILSPWVDGIEKIAMQHERQIVRNVNSVCRWMDVQEIAFFSDLFRSDLTLLATLPELDPYKRDSLQALYLVQEKTLTHKKKIFWQDNGKPKVFVYLKRNARNTAVIMEALQQSDLDVICCCPNSSVESKGGMQVFSEPVELAPILPSADCLINHASKELVCEGLCYGVPQIVAPAQLEQVDNGRRMEILGVGIVLPKVSTIKNVRLALDDVLSREEYKNNAQQIANNYAQSTLFYSVNDVVKRIEQLIT